MKTFEIPAPQVKDGYKNWINTRPNGDIELQFQEPFKKHADNPQVKIIGVLPKSQRAELAKFLLEA